VKKKKEKKKREKKKREKKREKGMEIHTSEEKEKRREESRKMRPFDPIEWNVPHSMLTLMRMKRMEGEAEGKRSLPSNLKQLDSPLLLNSDPVFLGVGVEVEDELMPPVGRLSDLTAERMQEEEETNRMMRRESRSEIHDEAGQRGVWRPSMK